MNPSPTHLGLGTITSAVGLNRTPLKTVLKLGAGSVAAITLSDLLQSRILVRNGAPVIPSAWGPAFTALFSMVAGGIAKKKGMSDVGDGMIAGGVGVGISALIARFTNPTVAASQAAASAAESSGGDTQAVAGFGFGRAFARGLGGLSGVGLGRADNGLLFGVGTPDMSGARMFNGATVAVEEKGLLSGATVAIENPNAFASSLY